MTAHGTSIANQGETNGEEGSQEGRGEEGRSEGHEEGREEAVVGSRLGRFVARPQRVPPPVVPVSWTCGGYQTRSVAAGHSPAVTNGCSLFRHSRAVSAEDSVASAGERLRAAGQVDRLERGIRHGQESSKEGRREEAGSQDGHEEGSQEAVSGVGRSHIAGARLSAPRSTSEGKQRAKGKGPKAQGSVEGVGFAFVFILHLRALSLRLCPFPFTAAP